MPPQRKKSSKTTQKLSTSQILILLALFAVVLIYQSLQEQEEVPAVLPTWTPALNAPAAPGNQPGQAPAVENGSISVYFTDPANRDAGAEAVNQLVSAINSARQTVDLAVYNLSLPEIGEALIAAHERGVQVRVVMESEAMERQIPLSVVDAGIPMVGDQREGLMHNKFTIIDGQLIFGGSANYTSTSFFSDYNNLVMIYSPEVAQAYTAEFDEMFNDGSFGPGASSTFDPEMNVNGIPVEVYFSPDDGVALRIINELSKARRSINFLAYSFTSDPIADEILKRSKAGVTVRGVFDESQNVSNRGGEYDRFKKAGLDVRIDGISGLLHNKVFIIDEKTVITGSYNFSASAENRNDENIMIIRDPAIAAQYLEHFETVYATGK